MLTVCQQKLQTEAADVRSRVHLIQGDMSNFELSAKFALITIPFRPFQHLVEIDEQCACLRCIHRHLADDGRLVFDVFNPSLTFLTRDNIGREEVAGPDFSLPDGRQVAHRVKLVHRDLIKQVQLIELIYDVTQPNGEIERTVHAFSMRHFFRYEVEHLLARCGFTVEALYGDYAGHPFSEQHSGDLVFVALKSTG